MKRGIAPKDLALSWGWSFSIASYGQGRAYIRKQIDSWGECRNVAITKSNGDLALYGRNGFAKSDLPYNLNEALTELNNERKYIDDVQLTENGRWLILWGNNGIRWNNIPYSLERKVREYNNNSKRAISLFPVVVFFY